MPPAGSRLVGLLFLRVILGSEGMLYRHDLEIPVKDQNPIVLPCYAETEQKGSP